MPKLTSGVTVPLQANARVRVHEWLAAVQSPPQADLAELQKVASNLDLLLVVKQVEWDELVEEFEQTRKGQHPGQR